MQSILEVICELLKKLAISSISNTSTRGNYQKDVRKLKENLKLVRVSRSKGD